MSEVIQFQKEKLILSRFNGAEVFPILKSSYSFKSDESMPLNGKIISGKELEIKIFCGDIENSSVGSICDEPSILIEIYCTNKKLEAFNNAESNIFFPSYVLTDEWEVMASLYCSGQFDIKKGNIEIVSKNKEDIVLKISGEICDVDYGDSKPPTKIALLTKAKIID